MIARAHAELNSDVDSAAEKKFVLDKKIDG